MKILMIHEHGRSHGSGGLMAMYRLHTRLRQMGIDSVIACRRRQQDTPDIVELPRADRLEGMLGTVSWRLGLNDVHCVSSFKIAKFKPFLDADVVNAHGLHTNFFNYLALPRLAKIKPLVATLHDMWHFTGHCGIALNCERWKTGCGHCPDLNAFPPVSRDSTALEWRLKRQVYQHMNMHVVAPSQWLADQASQSILRHFPIHLIRHAIDTQTYQPQDQQAARAALDLPQDKHVLMFSANVLTDHIKGADLLLKMVRLLPAKIRDEMILLLVGEQGWELAEATGMPRQCRVLGYLREEAQKAQAYSASDVFVMPSRFEVQGLVALEALACGVPVVAFRVGGIPEAVRPGHSGMLAEPEDAPGLATAVATLLRDRCLRQRLGSGGRILVESEFSIDRHVNQYLGVYEQAIAQHRGAQRQAVLQ